MRATFLGILFVFACGCSKPPTDPVGVSNASEATPPSPTTSATAAPTSTDTPPPATASDPATTASAPASTASAAPTDKPGTPPGRPRQGEGKTCGGIAALQCADGLVCKMTGPMHPDKSGVCARP